MIDHERARELALASVTDLDPADRAWLAAHLERCEPCSTFVAEAMPADAATAETLPAAWADVTDASGDVADPRATRGRLADRLTLPEPLRRRAVVVTVAAVTIAIVAGGLAWNASPRTDRSVAESSRLPTASPASSEGSDPWASLDPSASFEPLAGESPTPTAALT
ncbi:MAG TPA: hypothetical protein VFY18_07275, partial [Candidatus Limnocylindrales bacterium]|nr:hypothetical protein [Candidatus Limnocylindrales bacterium]